jgi:hypothetical protein
VVLILDGKTRVKWQPIDKALGSLIVEAERLSVSAKNYAIAGDDEKANMCRYKRDGLIQAINAVAGGMPEELRGRYT